MIIFFTCWKAYYQKKGRDQCQKLLLFLQQKKKTKRKKTENKENNRAKLANIVVIFSTFLLLGTFCLYTYLRLNLCSVTQKMNNHKISLNHK